MNKEFKLFVLLFGLAIFAISYNIGYEVGLQMGSKVAIQKQCVKETQNSTGESAIQIEAKKGR